MKKYIIVIALLVLAFTVGGSVSAHAETKLTGWAWSSNIGWISFNSADTDTPCATGASPTGYCVTVDSSGNFGGYAWSSNIGWISFSETDNYCGPRASFNKNTGAVTGLIRAVKGKDASVIAGGWDGCIELTGNNHTLNFTGNGGVTYVAPISPATMGEFVGYAWGGPVVGWMQFSPKLQNGTVIDTGCPNGCDGNDSAVPTVSLQVLDPVTGTYGLSATISQRSDLTIPSVTMKWTVTGTLNANSCTASGKWSGIKNSTQGTYTEVVSGLSTNANIFNLSCTASSGAVNAPQVTVTVNPYNAVQSSRSCVAPTHSSTCAGAVYTGVPSEYPLTNVVQTCPVAAGSFCPYTCNAPYRKNGNTCTRSTYEEH